MFVIQAFDYELAPTRPQADILQRYSNTRRWAKNHAIAERKEHYEKTGRSLSAYDQDQNLRGLKNNDPEYAWLKTVSKCVPQKAIFNVADAFDRFFKGLKGTGPETCFPKFERKHAGNDRFSLDGVIKLRAYWVELPTLGRIRLKESAKKLIKLLPADSTELGGPSRGGCSAGPETAQITSVTIRREADRWFAALRVRIHRPDPAAKPETISGLDAGLRFLAVVSDETDPYLHPNALEENLPKLQKRQHRFSKKLKRTKRLRASRKGQRTKDSKLPFEKREVLREEREAEYAYRQTLTQHEKERLTPTFKGSRLDKAKLSVARLQREIANATLDPVHKLTTHLTRTKSVIVIEGLRIGNMLKNRPRARRIHAAGWGMIKQQLGYKRKWYGCKVYEADSFFPSTKTCWLCGAKKLEELKGSVFECPCGWVCDRDRNAALNLEWLYRTDGILEPPPEDQAYRIDGVLRQKPELKVPAVRREVKPVESTVGGAVSGQSLLTGSLKRETRKA